MTQAAGKVWRQAWKHGSFELHSLGGMLGPIAFRLGSTRQVQPLSVSPWSNDSAIKKASLPPILHNLRGDFACVPFGAARAVDELASDWKQEHKAVLADQGPPHGESSNAHWSLVSQSESQISIECAYSAAAVEQTGISKLVRTITPAADSARLDIELEIHAARDTTLTLGLHPIFDTAFAEAHSLELRPGRFRFGLAFPGRLEPSSIVRPGAEFKVLSDVPLVSTGSSKYTAAASKASSSEGTASSTESKASDTALSGGLRGAGDFSRLPRTDNTENLLQLCGVDGSFDVVNHAKKYVTQLRWDAEHFPSVILWVSNRGRDAYPWNSRFRACGIEPVCAAFDLGVAASQAENPISKRGVPTVARLSKGKPLVTRYSIGVVELAGDRAAGEAAGEGKGEGEVKAS